MTGVAGNLIDFASPPRFVQAMGHEELVYKLIVGAHERQSPQ